MERKYNLEERIMDKIEKAVEYKHSGYNCCQSVRLMK